MYENGGVDLKNKERKKKKERRRRTKKKKKTLEWVWRRKKNKEEDEEKKKALEWVWRRKKEEGENVVGDVTMHWRRGPLRQLIYVTATESQIMSFENSWNVFLFSFFITHFFESLNHQNWITKHELWSPNKMSSVGPINFGSWVMKTGSYHSKLTTSKHALSHYIFLIFFFFFMYAVQCLWVELRFLYSFTLFFYIYFFLHFYVSNYSYFFFINYGY